MCVCVCAHNSTKILKIIFNYKILPCILFAKLNKQIYERKKILAKSVFKHDSQFVFTYYSSVFYTNSLKRSNLRGHNLGFAVLEIPKKEKENMKNLQICFYFASYKTNKSKGEKAKFLLQHYFRSHSHVLKNFTIHHY